MGANESKCSLKPPLLRPPDTTEKQFLPIYQDNYEKQPLPTYQELRARRNRARTKGPLRDKAILEECKAWVSAIGKYVDNGAQEECMEKLTAKAHLSDLAADTSELERYLPHMIAEAKASIASLERQRMEESKERSAQEIQMNAESAEKSNLELLKELEVGASKLQKGTKYFRVSVKAVQATVESPATTMSITSQAEAREPEVEEYNFPVLEEFVFPTLAERKAIVHANRRELDYLKCQKARLIAREKQLRYELDAKANSGAMKRLMTTTASGPNEQEKQEFRTWRLRRLDDLRKRVHTLATWKAEFEAEKKTERLVEFHPEEALRTSARRVELEIYEKQWEIACQLEAIAKKAAGLETHASPAARHAWEMNKVSSLSFDLTIESAMWFTLSGGNRYHVEYDFLVRQFATHARKEYPCQCACCRSNL